MTHVKLVAAAAAMLLASTAAVAAHADDFQPAGKGSLIVDVRVTDVWSNSASSINTAVGTPTGLHVHVGDSVMPTLGFVYFLSDNFAVEAILGTTQHNISAEGPGVSVKAASTWVIPPVVTLQYYPMPKSRFSPYVGAGVNAMIYYGGKNDNGFTTKLKDNVGVALQVGANYAVSGPWLLNADLKKVFVTTNADINNGALNSKVNVDPWVASIGFSRKF